MDEGILKVRERRLVRIALEGHALALEKEAKRLEKLGATSARSGLERDAAFIRGQVVPQFAEQIEAFSVPEGTSPGDVVGEIIDAAVVDPVAPKRPRKGQKAASAAVEGE